MSSHRSIFFGHFSHVRQNITPLMICPTFWSTIQILRALTPEEYLHQTGVFSAMKEALGNVAELRPSNPLLLFAEMWVAWLSPALPSQPANTCPPILFRCTALCCRRSDPTLLPNPTHVQKLRLSHLGKYIPAIQREILVVQMYVRREHLSQHKARTRLR